MFVSDCLDVNSQGHLTIGGADTLMLASEFGTPLYVMSEEEIRSNCRRFQSSIDQYYGGNGLVAYASKAFCCKAMYQLLKEEGLGADIVSGGELHTAISAEFPAEKLFFHGNNKTVQELARAVEYGVGRIVVDNLEELQILNKLAASTGKIANIMLRIKPGIDAHTHDFIRTGQIDSKFGWAIETGEAMAGVKEALHLENIRLRGLHCHIGSQIFDIDPFELVATTMLEFMNKVKSETGAEIAELNLGGGFGIKYIPDHDPQDYENYMERVSVAIKKKCSELGLKLPFIVIEPGRSIVGAAGITLYTVGAVKTIPGIRTYVSIDGGMTDNPRYALYKSQYEILVASRANEAKTQTVTLAGKCCESGDLIGEGLRIGRVEPLDVVAVLSTGAYNYSMSSNYNRNCRPPVVFVKAGKGRLVVKREMPEDLIRNDLDL